MLWEQLDALAKSKMGPTPRRCESLFNERLCKVLCHNLIVLIHEMQELGIEAMFWQSATV